MKKINFDKNYIKISLYAFATIAALILFEKIAANPAMVTKWLGSAFRTILKILMPFLYGFVIAYFLNAPIRFVENALLAKIKFLKARVRLRRGLSVGVIYILVLGAIVWLVAYLVPELIDSVRGLVDSITKAIRGINAFPADSTVQDLLDSINLAFSTNFTVQEIVNKVFDPILKMLSAMPAVVGKMFAQTVSLAGTLLNVVLGLIIGIYMLCEKENVAARITQVLFTIFKPTSAMRVLDFSRRSNMVFEKFIVGKALDSLIIGILFFIISTVMKLPYPLLLSLIVGVTNMIPYFGPFIGAAPTILIVLINSLEHPLTALWTAIAILILQQFDGSILGPKILGDSTGLKPMGVIFSITVGGALFGVPGMFFGVPLFAVISQAVLVLMDRKYRTKYTPVRKELEADGERKK